MIFEHEELLNYLAQPSDQIFNAALAPSDEDVKYILDKHPKFFSNPRFNDNKIIAALRRRPVIFKYIPKSLQTYDEALFAIKKDGYSFEHIPESIRSEELALIAIHGNPLALSIIPPEWQTSAVVALALKKNPICIHYVAIENQKIENIKTHVKCHGFTSHLLFSFRQDLITDEVLELCCTYEQEVIDKELEGLVMKGMRLALKSGVVQKKLGEDNIERLLFVATHADDIKLKCEAMIKLESVDPVLVAPLVITEKQITIFKEVYGIKAALALKPSRQLAKRFLGDDLGL